MTKHVHPADGMTYACPACDRGGDLYQRTGQDDPEHEFHCMTCGHETDTPVERAYQRTQPPKGAGKSWLEKQLDAGAEVEL